MQNPNITADNIVEEISKQVKHYPSEKIYKISYLNEIAFFKLYVNDVLVYREFQFPQGGSVIDINNVINKSGIHKVSYQLSPIEKTEEYSESYSTLTEDTNMLVTLKSYDKKKKKIKKEFTRLPIAEFAGVKATFVAIGTVKLGVFKRTLSYEG